jgi:hypothetical protein
MQTSKQLRPTREGIWVMAQPTIAVVLAEFLEEQRPRLAPKIFAQYQDVVELLQHCLNGYGYLTLRELDAKRFDQRFTAPGDAHREFCELFGPEYILPNVGEFLGYFMVRKVSASQALLRAAGTVTKKLAAWLAEKGYADTEIVKVATEQGAAAARDLPKAEALATRLAAFAEAHDEGDAVEASEDHFRITRVEPGRIWLEGLDGREHGPIRLPQALSRQCEVGWTISGVVGRVGGRWQLLEAWNVYPS